MHIDTLCSTLNLGRLHRKRGEAQAAEARLRSATQGFNAALGSAHQLTVCAATALALLLAQQERTAEAAELWHHESPLGPMLPETREDARELASLLRSRGEEAAVAEIRGTFGLLDV